MGVGKLSVIQRHYIGNDETYQEFLEIAQRTKNAALMLQDACFGMLATYSDKLTQEQKRTLWEYEKDLASVNVNVSINLSDEADGPGAKIYNGLFKFMGTEGVKFLIDGDQFRLDNPLNITAIKHVADRMRKEDAVLGMLARDKVSLAADPVLDRRRKIHEVMMFSIDDFRPENPLNVDLRGLEPAYKEFGEGFIGSYCVNWDGKAVEPLKAAIDENRKKIDFRNFVMDYYMTPKAKQLGKVISVYVECDKEHPAKHVTEKRADSIIRDETGKLLKTDMGEEFRQHFEDPATTEKVAKHYPIEDVLAVKKMMLSTA